jgi:hypothetical protein
MAKEIMDRRATDNAYLHKDFHGALSAGLEYLHVNFGEESVRDYLRQFTKSYYAPLIDDIRTRGLTALKEHFEKMYSIEDAEFECVYSGDELILKLASCPAVMHMRKNGYHVARLFHESTKTVNETLCDGTPYKAELLEYDYETGKSVQRFSRRGA